MNVDHALLEDLQRFFKQYCEDELSALGQQYPKDKQSIYVDYHDLYRFNPDLADDLRNHPDDILQHMSEAVDMIDLPADVDLSGVTVRVSGLNDEHVYGPGELRSEHAGEYVGIRGNLERVTTTSDLPEVLAFRCKRCGNVINIPQSESTGELQEPHECGGCERQGPFDIDHDASEWSDYSKLRIESRPGETGDSQGTLTGYALNDLIDEGGENGLIGRAGEPVTVYGVVHQVQKQGRGENQLLFDHMLEARAVEFDRDGQTINIADHRDTFEEIAAQPDAVDQLAASIAPQLHETPAWETAMEFAVAYLFGAPRVDLDDGPTYRGDLHLLIISDFGQGKSTFKGEIEAYSPKCISKSTTALSSGVGLTAAAVKDDFGEGQWTIKPGLLVRANGGHLILDEIDKGPDELTEMNDAIEGQQVVDVEKAGRSVTYDSKTGVMALGNPTEGRFDPHTPIAEQLGISETLLSRFDGIVTMSDTVDEEMDAKIAETWGRSYTEAQQAAHGDRESFDQLERQVPVDVGQAWIKYARENVNPILTYEKFAELKDWYSSEVRQLNETFAGDGEGQDMPVPATVRVLPAAVKMAIAFARCRLQPQVRQPQIERAKALGKKLIKQNWNGERFDATKNVSQQSAIDRIRNTMSGAGEMDVEAIADRTGLSEKKVRGRLENLKNQRQPPVIEPERGVYRWVRS